MDQNTRKLSPEGMGTVDLQAFEPFLVYVRQNHPDLYEQTVAELEVACARVTIYDDEPDVMVYYALRQASVTHYNNLYDLGKVSHETRQGSAIHMAIMFCKWLNERVRTGWGPWSHPKHDIGGYDKAWLEIQGIVYPEDK